MVAPGTPLRAFSIVQGHSVGLTPEWFTNFDASQNAQATMDRLYVKNLCPGLEINGLTF